jgi:hypothetical protein
LRTRLPVLPSVLVLLVLTGPAHALTNPEPSRNETRWHDDKPELLHREAYAVAVERRLWDVAVGMVRDAVAEEHEADMREAERAAARGARPTSRPSRVAAPSTGRCGGDLPSCEIMERESGGSLTAQNPTSSASGKWQFIDSTWNDYGGYPTAADAPEDVQDAKARELWAGGAGCSHWSQTASGC